MNVLIRARTSSGQYSGGRLHAWVLAEGFAALGHEVVFWGEGVPVFVHDFAEYPGHHRIRFHSGPRAPGGPCHLVLVVPHMDRRLGFYYDVLAFAACHGARIVLLNFESANWFNSLSPEPRDPALWNGWRLVARHADIVLSSTREGTRFAREFYTDVPQFCVFTQVAPAINSLVADNTAAIRENQIVCLNRFSAFSRHKGGFELTSILGPYCRGYTLLLIVGTGEIDREVSAALDSQCAEYGVKLRTLSAVSDKIKFEEIKRSRLMVFLSTFEGFGYPPVEALYCNTACIAYDLPVLHEAGGGGITFVPVGDREALRTEISNQLSGPAEARDLRACVVGTVGFSGFCENLKKALFAHVPAEPRGISWRVCLRLRLAATYWYYVESMAKLINRFGCRLSKILHA